MSRRAAAARLVTPAARAPPNGVPAGKPLRRESQLRSLKSLNDHPAKTRP
jgi:hypothetical protein